MKSKQLLYISLLLIFFYSCVKEAPMWERTYQISNNSGFDVNIRAFENFTGVGDFLDVNLSDSQIYTGNKSTGSNFDAVNNPNNGIPTSSFGLSRFIVVFNNERKMTHSFSPDVNNNPIFSNPIDRNLLRGGNYFPVVNDIYQINLTQEDYDNAKPCIGDCLD